MEDQWCNLPKDILEAISKKILSVEDYLRFRAVCIPWRSGLSPNPHYLPPQSPWLMLPYKPNRYEGNNENSARFFYDTSSNKIRKIEIPETCSKEYIGSSKGWLMLKNGPEISLLNPITKTQINLPSLESSPNILGFENIQSLDDIRSRLDIWSSCFGRDFRADEITVLKIILTSNPTVDPNCIMMAHFQNNWELAFCRVGDESWTILKAPNENYDIKGRLVDVIFHNKLFYCFSFDQVKIYNLDGSKREVLKIKIPLEPAIYHLVEGNFNEVILMVQHMEVLQPGEISRSDVFSVYKLGTQEGQPDWIEIEGIGQKTCFSGDGINQCFTLEGLRGNIVYYAHPTLVEKITRYSCEWFEETHMKIKMGYEMKMVKLSRDQQENVIEINKDFGLYSAKCSKALWFTPSLY